MTRPQHKLHTGSIAALVFALHVVGLWGLQRGLVMRPSPTEVSAPEISVQLVNEPNEAVQAPPTPTTPQKLLPATHANAAPATTPVLRPTPAEPAVLAATTASPTAFSVATPPPAQEATAVASNTTTSNQLARALTTAPATTAATAVELPSSDADYLHNPRPPYPPMSSRLREQGKVVIHALIGTDGTAQKAEIKISSGFERLDQAALKAALKWKYTPGKRAGVAEAMWFDLPFVWSLE